MSDLAPASSASPTASAAPLPPPPARLAAANGRSFHDLEAKPRPSQRLVDRVELSDRAMYLERLRSMPLVREGVVADVRSAIESGSYSIDDKIGLAVERLLADLAT